MKSFYGSIFISKKELKDAGIEYPIKVEYYKIISEKETTKSNESIFGIQAVKTEYRDKIGIEQSKVEHITNDEKQIEQILEQIKRNEVTPVSLEEIIKEIKEDINSAYNIKV